MNSIHLFLDNKYMHNSYRKQIKRESWKYNKLEMEVRSNTLSVQLNSILFILCQIPIKVTSGNVKEKIQFKPSRGKFIVVQSIQS